MIYIYIYNIYVYIHVVPPQKMLFHFGNTIHGSSRVSSFWKLILVHQKTVTWSLPGHHLGIETKMLRNRAEQVSGTSFQTATVGLNLKLDFKKH